MFKYVILLVLPAFILAQDGGFFNLIDANGDGVLDRSEVDTFFLSFDENSDDRIERHEFTVKLLEIAPFLDGHEHEIYDRVDMNGDHHVDHADFDLWFQTYDADGDGLMTHLEFLAQYTGGA